MPRSAGLCECGCGEPAPIAKRTDRRHGWVRGQPVRFVRGHSTRGRRVGPRKADRYRVEDRGYDTPCWVWQLAKDRGGYGRVADGGVVRFAHRVYYVQAHGSIPDGLGLDHLCRVAACVNPDHLEPATQATNTRRGIAAKLTAAEVAAIRKMIASGLPNRAIAERFDIAACSVSDIKTGRSWAA